MNNERYKRNGKVYFDIADLPERSLDAVNTLTNVIQSFNKAAAPDEAFNKKRNEATDDLKAFCHDRYDNYANVYIYGSSINGFGTNTSDIDCIIVSKFDLNRKASYFNPLLKALKLKDSPFAIVNFVRSARIPLITVKHKKNGMELDITFASDTDPRMDVLENSALLNAYAMKNTKIPAVGRFLKSILLNLPHFGSAKVGGLSSYSHTVMLVYYLLHGTHRIQHIKVETPYSQVPQEIAASEGEMFLDFLRFYACEFDSSKYSIDIRFMDVIKMPAKKNTIGILTLEDPIIEKNLGRTMQSSRVYELKLFYYKLLCEMSSHKMNEAGLRDYLSNLELKDLELKNQSTIPRLHPFCEPDYGVEEDQHKKGRQNKKQTRQNKAQKLIKENITAEKETVVSPEKEATSNATTSRQRKRNKNKQKSANSDTLVDGASQDLEQGLMQNDPYLLEELMKEIETPSENGEVKQMVKTKKKPWEILQDERTDTIKLTKALLEQAQKLDVNPDWNIANYYSTDVIGDSRLLIMVPLLAALGFKTPSIQVGNCVYLEKLKCIPGFNPELTHDQMNTMMQEIGCFIGYSKDLNIIEGRMASVFQSVGTLKSSQIDLARQISLTSACGTQHLLCDIKCDGVRNKYNPMVKVAHNMTSLAKEVGIKCRVQITDSSVPYSNMLGYHLELRDVVEVLDGEGSTEMMDVIALQCGHLLQMAGKAETLKEGEKQVFDVLANGTGLVKFLDMLAGQGVSQETIASLKNRKWEEVFSCAANSTKVESRVHGIVRDIKLDMLERVVVGKQGGYGASGEGLQLHVDIGSRVNVGTCLVSVHHNSDQVSGALKKDVQDAIEIEKVNFSRVIRTFRNDHQAKKERRKSRKSHTEDQAGESGPEKDTEESTEKKSGAVVEKSGEEAAEKSVEVESCSSSDSVPKDYVVVVSSENGEEKRKVELSE